MFNWIKKLLGFKEEKNIEFENTFLSLNNGFMVPIKINKSVNKTDGGSNYHLHENVYKKFRWFKCTRCEKKVYSKNGSLMYRQRNNNIYERNRKWCKECVADLAYAMNVTGEDIKLSEKRLILKKLE